MQSDSRLVKLFRRGVEPAFDELVNRYRGALVAYAGAIAGRDRAEDVVQDSLVKAHRSLSGDQSIEPKPWLYKVVRNTALNDIRDNRKHDHDGLGDSATERDYQQPHEVAERREELAAVVTAVSALPASQRRALVGHELGGFSYDEIAAELDVTPGATKQLIYRARLSLRNGLGALIPFPVIVWLASDTTSMFAAGAAGGAATGAAATGAFGASGGAAVGTAGTGGIFAGLAGAGTTKLAVVAIVAGGSIAGGVVAERQHESTSRDPDPAAVTRASGDSARPASGGPDDTSVVMAGLGAGSSVSDKEDSGRRPEGDSGHDGDSSGGKGPKGDDTGRDDHSGSDHEDRPSRPEREDTDGDSGSDRGERDPRPEGDRPDSSGPGGDSGDYRPSGGSGSGGYRPPRPAGDDGSDSGSSGGDSSGSSGTGSYGGGSYGSGSGDGGGYHPETSPEPDPDSSGSGSAED